ncbi:MAG: hypothetical protein ACRD16_03830 [Thermoanaerobaculia bacterium]
MPVQRRTTSIEARLRLISRAVLAAGFVGAVVIFLAAGPEPENALGYDPMDTKMYRHDLEVYGGTANVLAAEFLDWFAGLWHGRNLAFTVAALTVLTVLAIRFVGRRLPEDEAEEEDGRVTPFRPRS